MSADPTGCPTRRDEQPFRADTTRRSQTVRQKMPVISPDDALKLIEEDAKKSAGRSAQNESSQMPVRCRKCGASFRLGTALRVEQSIDSLQLRVQCVRCGKWIRVRAERLAEWKLDEFLRWNKAQDQGRNLFRVVGFVVVAAAAWFVGIPLLIWLARTLSRQ